MGCRPFSFRENFWLQKHQNESVMIEKEGEAGEKAGVERETAV